MTLQDLETKLKDFVNKNKLAIILVAVPLLILKYRSIIIEYLIKDANKINQEAVKQDTALQVAQATADTKANQIIADADQKKKDSDDKPVDENWNK